VANRSVPRVGIPILPLSTLGVTTCKRILCAHFDEAYIYRVTTIKHKANIVVHQDASAYATEYTTFGPAHITLIAYAYVMRYSPSEENCLKVRLIVDLVALNGLLTVTAIIVNLSPGESHRYTAATRADFWNHGLEGTGMRCCRSSHVSIVHITGQCATSIY